MNNLRFLLPLCLTVCTAGHYASAQSTAEPLSFGGDLRVRNEYMNNSLSLTDDAVGHDQDYYRIRTRIWSAWKAADSLVFNVRMAAEPRVWTGSPTFVKQYTHSGTEWRYGIVDSLNAKWSCNVGDSWTFTGTIGRQDLQLGDPGRWWLVADGTPGDGSWTSFFDALRVTLENKAEGLKIDFVAMQNRALPDGVLPVLGDRKTYTLAEQNERGLILYVTKDVSTSLQASGYFIYKADDRVSANGDDADIYTLGARLSGNPSVNWRYDLEAAGQFGSKNDPMLKGSEAFNGRREIRAWGADAKISYLFHDSMENNISLECEYLSGDDPDTKDDEMFDVLWGRYPRWSDAYAFAYAQETGGKLTQMNNLFKIGPSWSVSPTKKLLIRSAYALLFAPESTPTRATNGNLFGRDNHMRGQLWQVSARYQFTKELSGLLVAECFKQDDFYADECLDSFLRFEMQVKF